MKQLYLFLLLFGFSLSAVCAEQTPMQILQDAASKIENAPSVSALCTITANGHTDTARLTMSGNRFVVESPKMSVWFDGKTQWIWSADTREVNITEPTPQEIAQINPLAILSVFRTGYTASAISSSPTSKTIRLTAKSHNADIRLVELTLQTSSLAPQQIRVSYTGGTNALIKISQYSIGKKLPLTTFRYDSSSHPDAEIVDLR